MQTEPIMAFQIEPEDTFMVGEFAYLTIGEPIDQDDFLLFTTRDEEDELTEIPLGPFDVVMLVVSLDDPVEFEDVPIED